MKGHSRWALVFFLLFPGIAFAHPAQEGTRVEGSGGAGRHHYQGGCESLSNYTVKDTALSTQAQHRSGWVRASGGARYNRGEVIDGAPVDVRDCIDLTKEACSPDVGDVENITQFGARIGFETEHIGLEVGPMVFISDQFEEGILLLPTALAWVGVPDFYLFGTMLPFTADPTTFFSFELGLGHTSEELRAHGGPRVGPSPAGGSAASLFFGLDRRLDGNLWLGGELSVGPSETDRANYGGIIRVGYHFDD